MVNMATITLNSMAGGMAKDHRIATTKILTRRKIKEEEVQEIMEDLIEVKVAEEVVNIMLKEIITEMPIINSSTTNKIGEVEEELLKAKKGILEDSISITIKIWQVIKCLP
jgi:hypothetical protein